jgi:hypothetical protein
VNGDDRRVHASPARTALTRNQIRGSQIALRDGFAAADAARLASYGTMLLSIGTILGCLALPAIAERLGRRVTLGLYFVVTFLSIALPA